MRISVVVGSHRRNGVTEHLAHVLAGSLAKETPPIETDILFLADARLEPCQACRKCVKTRACAIEKDDFKKVLARLKAAEALVLITPRYAPIPSKVVALIERLTSISYNPAEEDQAFSAPLRGKPWGLLGFDSQGMLDPELARALADYLEGFASGYGSLGTTDPPMPPITTETAVARNASLEEHVLALARMMVKRLTQKEKR